MDSLETTNWLLVAVVVLLYLIVKGLQELSKEEEDSPTDYNLSLKQHLKHIGTKLSQIEHQIYMTDTEIKEEKKWRKEKDERELKKYMVEVEELHEHGKKK